MTRRQATTRLLAIVLASQVLTGCAAMVPFTHEIRTEHDLETEDLRELQFYVSHDVTLRREVRTKGRRVDDGQLKLHAGKTIEEIVIAEETPGVAVAIDDTSVTISFEEGSALDFTLRTGTPQPLTIESRSGFAEPPDPFPGQGGPRLLDDPVFEDAIGNYWLDHDDDTRVVFRGKEWQLVGQSFQAHLVIDAESLEDVVERRTTLGGRRVGQLTR
jgi:hypothetical protein